jgi:hypothetical protein
VNRYRDYNTYLKEIFGERVQKISLDAGLGCPNRDGTLSREGCIYCNSRGSGTGSFTREGLSISDQMARGRRFMERRYGARKFIAYFQSFTNTYAPTERLKELYDQAVGDRDVVGLSVATRPDCVDDHVLDLLASYQKNLLVCLELGLQSAHDITLRRIHRGHTVAQFTKSVLAANDFGLNVCAHIILGLPGETRQMMEQTVRFLSALPLHGLKIHLLYVIQGTPLATLYEQGKYHCLSREEYVGLVVNSLELLPPHWVIQRLTGDPAPAELVAPIWALEKSKNVQQIRDALERRDTWQGKRYRPSFVGK